MPHNPLHPPRLVRPAQKHFETHEVRRVPLYVSKDAQQALDASPHQGRLLPQALREMAGGAPGIREMHLDVTPRSHHLDVGPDDFHPRTGEEERVLALRIHHVRGSTHTLLINLYDIHRAHDVRPTGFRAHSAAASLVRSLPTHFHQES